MLNKAVSQIMATGEAIPYVAIGEFFRQGLEEMTRKGLGGVAIVDADMKLRGIITDGDIKRIIMHTDDTLPQLFLTYVEELMVNDPVSLRPEYSLERAFEIMRERTIWCMPVVDDSTRLVGFFQMHSVLLELASESDQA